MQSDTTLSRVSKVGRVKGEGRYMQEDRETGLIMKVNKSKIEEIREKRRRRNKSKKKRNKISK